jgi:membrane protease YdiL (CAAX protease family)
MTTVTLPDHLFIILFAIVHPVTGFISFRRLLRRVAAGEIVNRGDLYLKTIMGQWILFSIGMVVWTRSSRSWSEIGFSVNYDWRVVLGVVITLIVVAFFIQQIRDIRTTDKERAEKLVSQLGHLKTMLPRNGNELATFYGVSVTAGIVEEALWRGVLIWYLSQYMPLWAAAAISTIGFAAGHSYQGAAHVPGILIIGAVFTGLYVLTGSIWLPMILHILVDVLQGRGVYELIRRTAA